MAGPLVFYRDYMEFIEGKHISKHGLNGKGVNNSISFLVVIFHSIYSSIDFRFGKISYCN